MILSYLLGGYCYDPITGQAPIVTGEDTEARASARRLEHRAEAVAEDLATIALVDKVILRMLIKKGICTEKEFADLFAEIDLEDGKADGKLSTAPPRDCPNCGKRMPQNRTVCIYCGHQIPGPSILG
jgi:hypothetical protein